jgi:hypothetical protein
MSCLFTSKSVERGKLNSKTLKIHKLIKCMLAFRFIEESREYVLRSNTSSENRKSRVPYNRDSFLLILRATLIRVMTKLPKLYLPLHLIYNFT